jgi:UDP-N-acetyl-D-glucosamine/UDP-N-acetyl-D-galactosamine dehydrogenase
VIGLGYVGLPIALEFARKVPVIGFDIREDRVEMMKIKLTPVKNWTPQHLKAPIFFTLPIRIDLKDATFHIIAVPTPIDSHNMPDLNPTAFSNPHCGKGVEKRGLCCV